MTVTDKPTNPAHSFFYVSAVSDGGRRYLIAGPYGDHESTKTRVSAVREHACEIDPRAHFMAWGTASSAEPFKTPLGAHMHGAKGF
jgi:hypothetical protein